MALETEDISEKSLSELIIELTKLVSKNPNIANPENKKLTKYEKDYENYLALTTEIDNRENMYLNEKTDHIPKSILDLARNLPE